MSLNWRAADRVAVDAEYTEYVRGGLAQWRRTAYLMCGNWDSGDDIVQRVLTELYRNWPRARRADNLNALVRTMLLRRLIDDRRRGWARVRLTDLLPDRPAPAEPDPADRLDLVAALRQVAPRQRAVLVLRFFQDLTVEETAQVLNCAPGTVKSQTAKGLATLRRLLAPAETDALTTGRRS
ncbi:sigma-70 family RNA polymerase sigma factor [Plantactinospora soyae]|uniref:RNA polymerase sigma-70 factor (Sigma-E family) n=1 Tax=Plantactinospora soyae TaxID=1544732 RepID=A0A927R525_9ACTN|nr:sigma-70 family RNA polymerase sigma factor [Plantactinospora soyae]MBE1485536.1 RNA polymerase sigma-70 factor (sigma-E family) [Plantactinospora soyae]